MKNLVKYIFNCNQIYKLKYRYFACDGKLLITEYTTCNDRDLVLILLKSNKRLNKELEDLKL